MKDDCLAKTCTSCNICMLVITYNMSICLKEKYVGVFVPNFSKKIVFSK